MGEPQVNFHAHEDTEEADELERRAERNLKNVETPLISLYIIIIVFLKSYSSYLLLLLTKRQTSRRCDTLQQVNHMNTCGITIYSL